MSKCAWIGLGVMGYPMAGYLQKNGCDVTVYNRTAKKAGQWADQYKGAVAPTPAGAANDADYIFTCVGNDNDVEAVYLGEHGILQTAKKGAVLVDHTTASPDIAQKIAHHASSRGIAFMDAPVSGGEKGALEGILTIMCGAEKQVFDKAITLLQHYGRNITHIGPVGDGQKAKMVNQICIAGLLQALSEAMHFGQQMNIDMEKVLQAIEGGAAQSWQMNNRATTMLAGQYDFGFQVDWMRKDLAICFEQARKNGIALPVTALVDQYYGMVQKLGGQKQDTSALKRVLDEL